MDLDEIVFDGKPEKSELYFLNSYPLRKKGEEAHSLNGKFCSKGAHLGLSINFLTQGPATKMM